MATRNRNRNKRKRRSKSEFKKLSSEARQDAQDAQSLVALSALTDAFTFAAEAIGKKDAIKQKRKIENAIDIQNAKRLDIGAEDVILAGEEQAGEILKQGKQDASSLRARTAAQGIQVDFGSGAEGVEDILNVSGLDAQAIKVNAFRKAHNLNLQASDLRSQANLRRISGKAQEDETALTGGLKSLRSITGGIQKADGFSAFEFTR